MVGFDVFGAWSYVGIIAFLILTGCGFPLPEEVAFVYAGVQSAPSIGKLDWRLAIGACVVGAILGDSVMYGIGRLGHRWIQGHAWFAKVLHVEREEQIRRLIARHGIWFILGARFLVGVRGPLYVTLGILRISFLRFLLIDALCASLVVGVFFGLSYYFGEKVADSIKQGESLLTILVLVAVVLGGGLLWWYHNKRKKREAEELAAAPPVEETPNVAESILGVTPEELLSTDDAQSHPANPTS